ncbi:CoA-transferase subunit beta [Lacrimispora sphenoides]|uniref:Glutaconate CoA-transferase subunit B n=1 Tax=Lacrimispora sphenoides JCM 1415 TaxID=1297793 RepID=A0ABY1C5P6_9FIRM|nr:CoA-transferase [Lacrimispora sphenoides]SET70818.1 glutaconate CoA-transferase subunit B [[Clostridium] sphenoides JCM 1415]SUY50648.1 coenzyme A transferase [Lacrimispora sphenoides]
MMEEKYRVSDIMVCAMARLIPDGSKVFHGVSSHMPMIALLLAKALHAPGAVHLNIPGGTDPDPVRLKKYTSAGPELLERATAYFPLMEVFDLAMRGELDVAFLSGIQFDSHGNVNASVIGDYKKPKVRMPGGAGSAVLIPTAKRAILWRTKHDKRTFVNQVDFVTTRGNVERIITPLCIFKMENREMVLDTIHPTSSLEEVQENTGFPIKYSHIAYTPLPTKEELSALKRIDPGDFRNIEF